MQDGYRAIVVKQGTKVGRYGDFCAERLEFSDSCCCCGGNGLVAGADELGGWLSGWLSSWLRDPPREGRRHRRRDCCEGRQSNRAPYRKDTEQ